MPHKVLITGMSGLIGRALRRRLEEAGGYELSALNRRAVEGVPCTRADVADFDAIRPAFDGVETVVHLAAIASGAAPWDAVLNQNVIGTYNVFEAARQAGCRRVVFASSGATISNWEREEPYRSLVQGDYDELPQHWEMIDHRTPVRPSGLYGCSKVWGEALARHYTDTAELSALCVRIGRVTEADAPREPRDFAVWCSQRDVTGVLQACVDAPASLRFDVVYAVSRNRWGYRDMAHTREVLGYEPQDASGG